MDRFFKYFHFNTTERQGFIVLTLAIIAINAGLFIYYQTRTKEELQHHLYLLN